jgi:hypothetical protein
MTSTGCAFHIFAIKLFNAYPWLAVPVDPQRDHINIGRTQASDSIAKYLDFTIMRYTRTPIKKGASRKIPTRADVK